MTVDTEIIRNAAATLDAVTSKLPADHPLRMEAAEGAKGAVSGLYRVADEIDAQAAEIARLREALRKAAQLTEICTDWNLDEVEIDGEMVRTRELGVEFRAALAQEQGERK